MALVPPSSRAGSSSGGGNTLLATQTLVAPAATLDFSGLAGTYSHLEIYLTMRGDQAVASSQCYMRFNNDSGANYNSSLMLLKAGSVTGVANAAGSLFPSYLASASSTANFFNTAHILIYQYARTDIFKTFSSASFIQDTVIQYYDSTAAGVWASTAAITRVTFLPDAGNFVAGTQIAIYGIA